MAYFLGHSVYFCFFYSCIFHPCDLHPIFLLPHFPPLHFWPYHIFHSRIFSRPQQSNNSSLATRLQSTDYILSLTDSPWHNFFTVHIVSLFIVYSLIDSLWTKSSPSTVSGLTCNRLSSNVLPATENALSDEVLVAGTDSNHLAHCDSFGHIISLACQKLDTSTASSVLCQPPLPSFRNFSVEYRYRKTSLPLPRYYRLLHHRVIL